VGSMSRRRLHHGGAEERIHLNKSIDVTSLPLRRASRS
jgi:hypothetical protein